jgi:hypothetical protein
MESNANRPSSIGIIFLVIGLCGIIFKSTSTGHLNFDGVWTVFVIGGCSAFLVDYIIKKRKLKNTKG